MRIMKDVILTYLPTYPTYLPTYPTYLPYLPTLPTYLQTRKLATGELEEAERYALEALRISKEELIQGPSATNLSAHRLLISTIELANIYELMGDSKSEEVEKYDDIAMDMCARQRFLNAAILQSMRRQGMKLVEAGK